MLVTLAGCGAFIGDNLAYLLGRRFGPAVERRLFAGERGARRRAWAGRALDRYGTRIIIVCRFIPGGRTAVTLTCGMIRYKRRNFIIATACASVIWAAYAFFIGRLGGTAFEDRPGPVCCSRSAPRLRSVSWPRCCVASALGACSAGSAPAEATALGSSA